MSFEIVFKYHEKLDNGYNKEETKELVKKLGKFSEEVPLEKLANYVTSQLARRDIFIFETEIYEFKKTQLNFRETKGGIVIKNKKFTLDQSANLIEAEEEETTEQPQVYPHEKLQSYPHEKLQAKPQPTVRSKTPVKHVVYMPSKMMLPEIARKGIRFTPEKKYPVYGIKMALSGIGEVYMMTDDTGKEVSVSDEFFVPAEINLFADKELGFTNINPEVNLHWAGVIDDPGMPNLR